MSYHDWGEIAAAGAIFVAVLAGFAKCIQVAKRPQAQTACLLALTFYLLAITLSAGAQLLKKASESAGQITVLVSGILIIPLMLASFILAIVGLARYDSSVHKQGRAQAICSLILGALPILVVAVSAVGLAGSPKLQSVFDKKRHLSKAVNTSYYFPELGFRLENPGAQWNKSHEEPPPNLGGIVAHSLKFTNDANRSQITINAQELAPESPSNALSNAALIRMISAGSDLNANFGENKTVTIGGLEFLNFSGHTFPKELKQRVYNEYYFLVQSGYSYQFSGATMETDYESFSKEFRRILEGVSVTHEGTTSTAKESKSLKIPNARLGYTIHVENPNEWRKDSIGESGFEKEDVHALLAGGSEFFINSIKLPDSDVGLRALAYALLHSLEIPMDDTTTSNQSSILARWKLTFECG